MPPRDFRSDGYARYAKALRYMAASSYFCEGRPAGNKRQLQQWVNRHTNPRSLRRRQTHTEEGGTVERMMLNHPWESDPTPPRVVRVKDRTQSMGRETPYIYIYQSHNHIWVQGAEAAPPPYFII